MPRLQRYIFRELYPPLVLGSLLFTAVVSFGLYFVSSQWLIGAPVALILQYLALQVPYNLTMVFPMAVVLMVVVAYGRLANERELGAAQTGGVGLGRLAVPAALLALLVSGVSLYFSEWVVPRANIEARSLYWDGITGAGLSQLNGRTVEIGPGLELHFERYDTQTRRMNRVRLQQWQNAQGSADASGRQAIVLFADSGTYEGNSITLRNYRFYRLNYAAIDALGSLAPNVSDEAFREAVRGVFPFASSAEGTIEIDTGLSRKRAIAEFADTISADSVSLSRLWATANDQDATSAERQEARSALSRKLALPLGNLVLVLAALPFALRFGRTMGVALGVALLIAVAYYLTYVLGLSLGGRVIPQEVAPWVANVLFGVGGLLMLRRAS
ncbi:LptF/LptG family permease [Deinococcus yavapaiensis]|uniref:Lipopolysaccharide export system permease protein n=1 Tax=Deinococcus yavapaiensis KR-236 TaxID=694435 RepID=A0A318S6W0_9DEIO|nr:LptF/LptG family permease [Deinococcus yavapaiensis]PYE53495.1 lipopolysaccharide export system permease protein [Deinococcus yavapaiensis KR-236]